MASMPSLETFRRPPENRALPISKSTMYPMMCGGGGPGRPNDLRDGFLHTMQRRRKDPKTSATPSGNSAMMPAPSRQMRWIPSCSRNKFGHQSVHRTYCSRPARKKKPRLRVGPGCLEVWLGADADEPECCLAWAVPIPYPERTIGVRVLSVRFDEGAEVSIFDYACLQALLH